MYNAERKTLWLQSIADEDGDKQATSFLDRLAESVEEPLDTDLFALIADGRRTDVVRCLEENGRFFSYLILRRFCAYANAYLAWCYAKLRSEVPPPQSKLTAGDVSLAYAYARYFIRTQDELESALADAPLREGFILPVCCSLAWMGYSVQEMCRLRDADVTVKGNRVFVRSVEAPEGFVCDTLRVWARSGSFRRGVRDTVYVKADGDLFVRQTFPEGGVYTQLKNNVNGVRSIASRYVIRKTGSSVSFRQLSQAGEFHRLLAAEAAGATIDRQTVERVCGVKGQMALDRLNEFRQFQQALRL